MIDKLFRLSGSDLYQTSLTNYFINGKNGYASLSGETTGKAFIFVPRLVGKPVIGPILSPHYFARFVLDYSQSLYTPTTLIDYHTNLNIHSGWHFYESK